MTSTAASITPTPTWDFTGVEQIIIDAYQTPGLIPDGMSPQFLMENRDRPAIIGIIFMAVLATIVVVLRLYARVFVVKRFGLDDWLALLTLILYCVFFGLAIKLIVLGSGRHMAYIRILPNDTQNLTEILDWVGHIIYAIQLYVCRLSGLAFYRRLCERHSTLLLWIYVGGGFITAAFIPQIFLLVFHCQPVTGLWPYEWQPEFPQYKCMLWGIVHATNSALSVSCDLVVFVIPIAIIYVIRAPMRQKLMLSAVLLPGVLVIAISIARLYLVIRGGWVYLDGAWYYNPTLAVQNCEMAATMLALSVPGLKPLFGTWLSAFNITGPGNSSPRGTSGFSGGMGGSKLTGMHSKSKTVTNVSVVGSRIGDTGKWHGERRRSDVESEAGLEPGGSPPGMGGIHLGGMNSRDLGGIVVGRGFKIEVNKSDDSLLDERRGAVRLDEMRGNMFSHGR